MAKRVKRVGHPTATAQTFVGREREITIDTTVGIPIIHNGVTPGGIRIAREDLSNAPDATPTSAGKATAAQVSQINQNETDIAGLTNQLNNLMAVSVGFDPASSSLTATDVQAAIDELDGKVGAINAGTVSYDNTTSGLTATNVQAAVDEIVDGLGTASQLSKAQISDYAFAGSTKAVFVQSTAPLYWAIDATANDRVLRVNSASGGVSGGSWTISGITVDGHAVTIDEMPPHDHDYDFTSRKDVRAGVDDINAGINVIVQQTSTSTGGDQPHTHGLTADGTWRPAYIDSLICTKDAPTQ